MRSLESQAIYIFRELSTQCNNPAILFSGGKDSIVLCHLAFKAFYPANINIPLVHIDTGHNFPETIEFRDKLVKEYGLNLIVGSVQEAIDEGIINDETGIGSTRNYLQSPVLLKTLEDHNIDAAIGGGRRDEEKSRAKERVFSHRDIFGQWQPKNQRPELWHMYNARKKEGESFRVFPISDWTELDVWQYIQDQNIELPSLYYAHDRAVFERDGMLLAESEYNPMKVDESSSIQRVRCRTIGDITCTGLWLSQATNNEEIIKEIIQSEYTERGGRADDKRSETSLEDRKKEGYF